MNLKKYNYQNYKLQPSLHQFSNCNPFSFTRQVCLTSHSGHEYLGEILSRSVYRPLIPSVFLVVRVGFVMFRRSVWVLTTVMVCTCFVDYTVDERPRSFVRTPNHSVTTYGKSSDHLVWTTLKRRTSVYMVGKSY